MKILLLGGTGAMGNPLVTILSANNDNSIYVTSRAYRNSYNNVHYLQGNAKEPSFFNEIMREKYDVIVDFLVYSTDEFVNRIDRLLSCTSQYIFFSSARCFGNVDGRITEESKRLVEVCKDRDYLSTDEYGIAKGREENVLLNHRRKNWTIIRPYITYNTYRLQLGVYEKENWLKRALNGQTVVFPTDMLNKKTTLTHGMDVAKILAQIVGNDLALGEMYNITTGEYCTWKEIIEIYNETLSKRIGKSLEIHYTDDSRELQQYWNKWQIVYDRLYDRTFDNSKIIRLIGNYDFVNTRDGINESLNSFIDSPQWLAMNWKFEAWCDRQTRELSSLRDIQEFRDKLRYIKHRFLVC